VKKESVFSRLVKNSLIIGWLITLADRLYEAIPKSLIAGFLSDYGAFSRSFEKSFIGGFFKKLKIDRMRVLEWKNDFSRLVENCALYRNGAHIKEKLLTARLRTYGTGLFAYGITVGTNYFLRLYVFRSDPGLLYLGVSIACAVAGAVLIWNKKPLGTSLFDSFFIGHVLSQFVGVRREEVEYESVNDRGITLSFVTGIIVGLISCVVSPVYVFGAVGAAILLALLGAKPEFGIVFIALTLPFIPTMAMCGLTLYCVAAFLLKAARGKRTLRIEAIDVAVIIFMIFVFFGGVVSVDPSASLKSAAVFLALMMNYFLAANLIRSKMLMTRVMNSLVLSMLITALIGLYQKFFMAANTTWHDTSMFGDIGTRIYSTFQNPNVYGEYLVMAIPLSIALIFICESAAKRFPVIVSAVLALLALVYTQSRGAWLAFMISMAIYLVIKTGRTLVVFLLGIFSIPVLPFVLPESIVSRFMSIGNLGDSSTSYRVSIWEAASKMIGDFWLGGIGIGTSAFSKVYPSYSLAGIEAAPHSHHLFLQIAIEMGVFALVCFVFIIFLLIRKNSAGLMASGKKSGFTLISSAALCGIIGMIIQGMTDYVWYNYRVFGMFWTVMGLCVAALRCEEERQ